MSFLVNGIQQIGIGVSDANSVFNWYRKEMGFDILVFDDEAEASLMTQYTNDTVMNRRALLAMNMKGGGGLEIWQFKNRKPISQVSPFALGDLGINAMKLRNAASNEMPSFVQDPWGNWIQLVTDSYEFCKTNTHKGGVMGAIIGVSDILKSVAFYKNLLGFDVVKFEEEGVFKDFKSISGGDAIFKRVILRRSDVNIGGFGKLLGPMELELVQVMNRVSKKIYENRIWGDLGYIHLCFDVSGMDAIKSRATQLQHDFTVDSADSFDMGEAAGRFAYVEDPDGTLIELVETHKVPVLKKLGLYISLKNRNPKKPLPNWMVKAMKIHRKRSPL